jgi:carbonic anhydrase
MIRTVERADSMSKMKFATAINCMDGRTQLPVITYLKEKCKVDYVDMVTEASPVKILADPEERALTDSIKRRVEISTTKHGSRCIAVVGHFDCAGNPVDEGTQKKQIQKSVKTVLSWNFKANVLGLWVDENWIVHEVNDGT